MGQSLAHSSILLGVRLSGTALQRLGARGGRMIWCETALGRTMEGSRCRMTTFPGSIYDGQGASLDPTVPDLVQEQVDACPHRSLVTDRDAYPHGSLVTDRDVAPIVRVWLLANDATPDVIPHVLMIEAVKLVLAGKGVLILAQWPEPEVRVRTGLLRALHLFTASPNTTGRA